MSLDKANQKPINTILCLSGGGSACADQAGVIINLLEDPRINIKHITGISGGAFNAGILAEVFNKYGQSLSAKKLASEKLHSAWTQQVGVSDPLGLQYMAFNASAEALAFNPMAEIAVMWHQSMRSHYSATLKRIMRTCITEEEYLTSSKSVALHIGVVDHETGRGKILTGDEISRKMIMASAALQPLFDPVEGKIDGAHPGGWGMISLEMYQKLEGIDLVLCVGTAKVPDPIPTKLQQDLTSDDLGPDNVIMGEAYADVAALTKLPGSHKVVLVSPDIRYSRADKVRTDKTHIERLMKSGYQRDVRSQINHRFPAQVAA